jgi:UDP-GlcNAc:undecaprenyl-phosphate GlcNAc-1-phosphate transferase
MGSSQVIGNKGTATSSFVPVTSPTAAFLMRYGFGARAVELGAILAGAIGMLLVGSLDDRFELRPAVKLGGQALVAALVAAAGIRITLFVENTAFSYAVTILWVLTVINAFNFMDNMNGLCSGLGAIAAGFFSGIAAAKGQYLVALLAFASCGAMLGFIPWNFPRAKAFLGDGGSHLVGYLLAVLGILPHVYTPEAPKRWAVITPLVVLAVPLLDMVWVVILRWRIGQPFYQGDTNHLSHRLARAGCSRTNAVILIWGLAAAFGMISILLQ